MARQEGDQPLDRKGRGNGGDRDTEQEGSERNGLQDLRAHAQGFISGGCREGDQAEQETEFCGAHRAESDEVTAYDGHHGATGSGPHRDALQAADREALAGAEFMEIRAGLRAVGVFAAVPEIHCEHEEGTRHEGNDNRDDAKEGGLDPVIQQESEHGGGQEGHDKIAEEAQAVWVFAQNPHKDGEEPFPVEDDDCKDGTKLNDDSVGIGGVGQSKGALSVFAFRIFNPEDGAIAVEEGGLGIETQRGVRQDQVTGRGNR